MPEYCFGEDHQAVPVSVLSIPVPVPAAVPPWHKPSSCCSEGTSARTVLVKSTEARSANSPVSANTSSAMHVTCSMSSARGQSCVFFGRGNTHYLNSFSVVTTLSDPDFADSPCGGSRRSCRSMINTHFLPSQQKNCFEKSVS